MVLTQVGKQDLARIGPTTPTRPPPLPLSPWRLERLSRWRSLFVTERLSPSARERVPRKATHRIMRVSMIPRELGRVDQSPAEVGHPGLAVRRLAGALLEEVRRLLG